MRFLFYSHDGLGLGHTRRHLAVAGFLAERNPRAVILLATGAEAIDRQGLPRQVEVLKLPGLRKEANEKYAARRLGVSTAEIRSLRSKLLLTTVKSFRPDVLLVDKHPFGASGELKAGLKALRKQGGIAVLGLRDILDAPAVVLREWRRYRMQKRVAEFYDQVLIYGDKKVFDAVTFYEFPPSLVQRTRFCGYVYARQSARILENFDWPFPRREQRERPVVLATAGGGEDGFRALETFIRASAQAEWQGAVITGPMTPDSEISSLEALAQMHGIALRTYVPHLSALFSSLDALVCMGGYNTLVEAVAAGVPTVCVPRVEPRSEQLIRAKAFERLGLLQTCLPNEGVDVMRERIRLALRSSRARSRRQAANVLNLNGGERAAEHLAGMATHAVSFSS